MGLDLSDCEAMVFCFCCLTNLPLLNEDEDISHMYSKEKKMAVGRGSQNKCQIGASLELGKE